MQSKRILPIPLIVLLSACGGALSAFATGQGGPTVAPSTAPSDTPEGGNMNFPTTVGITIKLLYDQVEPWNRLPQDGITFNVVMHGTQATQMTQPVDTNGDGIFRAETRVLSLDLSGTVDAGPPLGTIEIRSIQSPARPSRGHVEQQHVGKFFPATATFDTYHIFFTPFGILHNEEPTTLISQSVLAIPATGPISTPFDIVSHSWLLDDMGTRRGLIQGGFARHNDTIVPK
jgi:hypothetical protein